MCVVERRYAVQTRYALERADSDPVRIADDRLPTPAQMDATGGVGELLERLGEARAESNRLLGDIAPALMTRPTIWARYDVSVRFRLHRFAAHVIEHTIQCEKTLAALDWQPTKRRRIARQFAALVGEIEGLGAHAEAREIEHRLVERQGIRSRGVTLRPPSHPPCLSPTWRTQHDSTATPRWPPGLAVHGRRGTRRRRDCPGR